MDVWNYLEYKNLILFFFKFFKNDFFKENEWDKFVEIFFFKSWIYVIVKIYE